MTFFLILTYNLFYAIHKNLLVKVFLTFYFTVPNQGQGSYILYKIITMIYRNRSLFIFFLVLSLLPPGCVWFFLNWSLLGRKER